MPRFRPLPLLALVLALLTFAAARSAVADEPIVIVGAGYGGVQAAIEASAQGLDVVLVDKQPVHTQVTRLHENAASDAHITNDLRALAAEHGFRYVRDEVTGIDAASQRVQTRSGTALEYQSLIIAVGSETAFPSRIKGLAEHSVGLRTLGDARGLRAQIKDRLSRAASTTDANERARLARIVVAGAGLTGVELAAELAEELPHLASAAGLPTKEAKIMLVQRSKLLSADRNLTDDDRKIVDKKLRSMGIDVRTGVGLEEVTPDSVRLASEGQSETVATETVIWTGGVRAPGFLKAWGVPLTDSGRIAVDAHLRVKGLSHVYAIGDAAAAPAGGDQEAPMTAQEAGVQGRLVAANLKKLQKGRPLTAYKPKNLGVAISLGRRDGLLVTLGLRIKGRPAALLKQVIEKRHERSLRRNGFRRGVRRAVDALTQKARGRVAPRPRLRTAR